MTTRWARLARGWLTASVAVFVAAFSHAVGGGSTPGLVGVVLAVAFAVPVSIALAGKSLSLARLSVSVGFSQFLFHILFGLGAAGGPTLTEAGSSHHAAVVSVAAAAPGVASHGLAHLGPWMWVAHALAAVVTIVALRRGEKAFWSLVEFTRTRLAAVLIAGFAVVPVRLDAGAVRAALAAVFVPTDLGVLLSSTPRRGPPRLRPVF